MGAQRRRETFLILAAGDVAGEGLAIDDHRQHPVLAMDSLEVPAEMRLIDKADIGGDRGDGLAPRQHRGRPLDADSDQQRMRRYAKLPSEGANDLKWRALRQRRKIRQADPIGKVVEHVIERASHGRPV